MRTSADDLERYGGTVTRGSSRLGQIPNFYRKFVLQAPLIETQLLLSCQRWHCQNPQPSLSFITKSFLHLSLSSPNTILANPLPYYCQTDIDLLDKVLRFCEIRQRLKVLRESGPMAAPPSLPPAPNLLTSDQTKRRWGIAMIIIAICLHHHNYHFSLQVYHEQSGTEREQLP